MANEENLKKGEATQFRSGEEAAENGKKGGIASGKARRRAKASRAFLKEILVLNPPMTTAMAKNIMAMGGDPNDGSYNMEKLAMVALVQRSQHGDVKATKYYHELLGEDPKTLLEKERMKIQKAAVEAYRNADGFMDAMTGMVEEVFEDGGDTPDSIEDSD